MALIEGVHVKKRDISALGLLVVPVVLIIASLGYRALQDTTYSTGTECMIGSAPTPTDPSVSIDLASLPEIDAQDNRQVQNLDWRGDSATIRTFLRASPPMPEGIQYLHVRSGQFQRPDGRSLDSQQIQVQAWVDPAGRRELVEMSLCVDPVMKIEGSRSLIASPGAYTGTVYIDDPRVRGGSAIYEIQMKYNRMDRVLTAVVCAGVLGTMAGVALASGLSSRTLWQNWGRTLSVVAATVSAVYVVYVAQYVNDPSWQGDTSLFTALFASAVGAAYAAANLAGTASIRRAHEVGGNGQGPGPPVPPAPAPPPPEPPQR